MAMPRPPRVLLLLTVLLGASAVTGFTNVPETPRSVCKGLANMNQYNDFALENTAECFEKCNQEGDKSCHLGNLQSYWLNLELYLVEKSDLALPNMTFVKAFVKDVYTNISEDLEFSLTPSEVPRPVEANEDKPPDRVRFPRSLFASLGSSREMVRMAVTVLDVGSGGVFKGPQLSQGDGSRVLNNRLLGFRLGNLSVSGLAEPLEITFSHQPQPPNMTVTCVFWDVTRASTGDWSSEGCSTKRGTERTVCHCDHLTFFTLLLRPVLNRATVEALTRVSQAGCVTSMTFLAFTIALYVVLRQRFKSEDAPKIHVALSISLFLLNLTFFINVERGPQGSGVACRAQGATFHYFLLCVFTWMGLEAFHLYLLVIRVFNTYFGHYFLKLSLVGWGLPALMVIGTGSADSYGLYTILDQEDRITLQLCWFQKETALYITVHGYFLITFLFSAVVLGLVAWKIFTLQSATAGKEQGQSWRSVFTVLGLSSLVGMTWGLAILTPLGLSTIYIFAIFNSLQGVFIFCWFLVLYFLSPRAASSSSGTAHVNQTQSVSRD
ncbi:Adhesion G protein-coupled receptor G3 [Galemys pyrenaicus]|uniref:Adhesion G protein-coupled receptor G3 n=1 Tax=Galemys pyrenaicus TaxID=202257 RepID=A0A8J6AWE4_GALPY|nr:Adhesion G protein-coupled receptor G3 [Galemys pyrenaicus]